MDGHFLWIIIIGFLIGGIIFLPIVFAVLGRKKRMLPRTEEDAYIMHLPQWHFWCGLLSAAFWFVFIVASMALLDLTSALYAAIVFIVMALAGTYLSIYSLLRKVVVTTDSLTIYSPFLPIRKIKFYEISLVGQKKYGLLGYTNSKKRFVIDKDAAGFDILYEKLYLLGKMERIQKTENFSVTIDRQDMIGSSVILLLFGGYFVAMLIFPDETVDLFLYILSAGLAVVSLYDCLRQLIWKLTVSFHNISVRALLKGEKSYSIQSITMVCMEKNDMIIYAGNKKIAKIFSDYKNYPLLLNYLADMEIPFYAKE